MPALRHHEPIGVEDYLAGELSSPVRHEFVNGDVFAMTGASLRHNALVGNLHAALRTHLRGTPCRVFFEAVKLNVARDNAYYYPDLMVACSDQAQALTTEAYVVSDPVLVVEVLSPATEHIDRAREAAVLPQAAVAARVPAGHPGRTRHHPVPQNGRCCLGRVHVPRRRRHRPLQHRLHPAIRGALRGHPARLKRSFTFRCRDDTAPT